MKEKHLPDPKKIAIPEAGIITDSWIDRKDLLAELQISTRTLDRWCQAGLAYSQIGSRRFFRQSEIHRFLLANEQRLRKRR